MSFPSPPVKRASSVLHVPVSVIVKAANFALHELVEIVEAPLSLNEGASVGIFGHEVTVTAAHAQSFDALATVRRDSGVVFLRHWKAIPHYKLRLGW